MPGNFVQIAPERPLLSQVLFEQPHRTFGAIASFHSNIHAVDAALMFAADPQFNVALVGPSGWGKTHLLQAVAEVCRTRPGCNVATYSAIEWLSSGRPETGDPLLLDNVQDALESARAKRALRVALERRVRSARKTMLAFTATRPTRQLKMFLPNPKEWGVFHMPTPETSERVQVIDRIAKAEGLRLNRHLIQILAARLHGNGRTYSGIVKRLRLHGTDWMTDTATFRAFGLLDPFFADTLDWDLAEATLCATELPEYRHAAANSRNMAIYALLRIAELPEDKVAHFFGVTPGVAFHSAAHFARHLDADARYLNHLEGFLRTVVHGV